MKTKIFIISSLIFFSLFAINYARAFMFWNQACDFSGTATSYISVNHSASLDIAASFSIELWINPVNSISPSSQIILEKRAGTLANGYTLYLSNGKVAIRTNSMTRLIGNTVLQNNVWTHITGTFNSASDLFSIYINGILDASANVTLAEPVTNSDLLRIGKGNVNSPFAGMMDELRVWRKVLSAAEVSQHRRTTLASSTGIYSSLVLSFTFQDNESSGADFSLMDWSNNGNNGTNNGVSAVDQGNRPSTTISLNESIELDGLNDFLFGSDNPDVSPTSAITLEAWIYPRSVIGSRALIFKGPPGGATTNYGIRLNGNILNAAINGNFFFNSTIPILPNLWTHIAFSYDGSTGRFVFYINGKKSGEGTNPVGFITNSADNLYIGGIGTSGNNFDGFIDEIRISNYIKPQAMINRFLYQSIDQANEPNSGLANVVYNLDGYAYDNADNGPLLSFVSNASFSHSGAIDNKPVSPINRADDIFFQDGFSIKSSNQRIPETGIVGVAVDSIEICLDTIITDINLFVALNHTAEEELELTLIGPNGEFVNIYSNQLLVPNANNIITIFDDQADSNVANNGRYVSFAPRIKPRNPLNSMFAGDNTAGTWRLVVNDEIGSGTGRLCSWGIQFNSAPVKLSSLCLKVFMQGFYRPDDSCVVDTLKVHLRESIAPYDVIAVYGETPDANFITRYTFESAIFGTGYYLQIEHRNSIETWSANPIYFDLLSGSFEYDFTVSPDSAFGSNEIEVDDVPLRYAMYGGDVNQDDIIDASDVGLIDNDVAIFAAGYVVTDLTGDNFVDASDYAIADNNAASFIVAMRP